MTVYLGTLGRMIPIYSTPSAQLETEERYTFSTTLEGSRKAQARPIGRRTWGLNAQFADPAEHSTLTAFVNGAWGPGPFIFVPADAPHTNLLNPATASCHPSTNFQSNVTPSGPLKLPDGRYAPRSFMSGAPATYVFGIIRSPLIGDGSKVTASVYLQGSGARVRLNWYALDGSYLSSTDGSPVGVTGITLRSSVTGAPPAGAVSVGVGALAATRCALPAITWGDALYPWSDGQGCDSAVVSALSRDQVLSAPGNTYSNVSFTVTEVG